MELISDILLLAGAFGAAVYCMILSRRVQKFTSLEDGMGGAVAVLSAQVDSMTKVLETARTSAAGSTQSLKDLTDRAEQVSRQLEVLVASLHDLPVADPRPQPPKPKEPARPEPAPLAFLRSRAALDSDTLILKSSLEP